MTLTFYSAQQAAEMTGMSVDWIWKQCRDGKIAHHKLGSKYRFTESDLSALAARSAVELKPQDDLIPTRGAS
jgi:excisionase family DNA binding protein